MKKLLLIAVMAVISLTASAQRKYSPTDVTKSRQHITHQSAQKGSFQAAEFKNAPVISMGRIGKKLTLDASRLQPVQHTKAMPVMKQLQAKMMNTKGRLTSGRLTNLKPTMTVQTNAPRKAPTFRDSYTGKATDYFTKTDTAWVMQPAIAQLEDGTNVNVLVDVIPLEAQMKETLSALYPNGVPVEYTMEDDAITIKPQAIASYEDENGVRNYLTLFCANSDDENGVICMQLADDGMLKVVNGNWVALGEFAGVPFDEDMGDSEAFIGVDELYVGVRYVYDGQKQGFTSEQEYKAYGLDIRTSEGVRWTMGIGTWTEDGEDYPVFINLSPFDDMFSTIYPDGIYVDYKKEGNTYTVEPQVIASARNEDGTTDYIMIFSGTNENTGDIVFKIAEDGTLTTIDNESIIIAAWSTDKYDPTFETYLGYYTYTDRVKYLLPDDPDPAPEIVSFAPNELVLFAGWGTTGYSFSYNLAVGAPYVPTNFINGTKDLATSFNWSARELLPDAEENLITANTKDFSLTLNPDATYTDISLVAANGDAKSDSVYFGRRYMETDENGNPTTTPVYEGFYMYAGGGESSFEFDDGSYAMVSRYNPDGEVAFYTNWATPDYTTTLRNPYSISKIYSYQGKPAKPLFLTGVKLPVLNLTNTTDDFNLHVTLYKCTRSSNERITLGDVIAEGDATIDNVTTEQFSNVTYSIVNFDELYVEDEFGMSETLDYLFIEDEFLVMISGIDNGTFSGRFASMSNNSEDLSVTWFEESSEEGSLYSFTGWKPAIMLGLNDATYGYLHTEDNTDLSFGKDGGTSTLHIDPMYYSVDEETEEYSYLLYVESVTEDGEEAEEIPEWISVDIANEDYTTAIGTDEDGEEYEYFVNGIDYDMVITVDALPEGVDGRTAELVFMQKGALLKVKVSQGEMQGISTVVTAKPLNNKHSFNLAGQRVNNAKGIVVKDGRKVIVK